MARMFPLLFRLLFKVFAVHRFAVAFIRKLSSLSPIVLCSANSTIVLAHVRMFFLVGAVPAKTLGRKAFAQLLAAKNSVNDPRAGMIVSTSVAV